jgi:hypothetical protein
VSSRQGEESMAITRRIAPRALDTQYDTIRTACGAPFRSWTWPLNIDNSFFGLRP